MTWTKGSSSNSVNFSDADDIYPAHINESRVSRGISYYVGLTTNSEYLCDGTADNVQIQAALDAASTAGGGIVHLGVGTFSLSQYIKIPTDVILEGSGFGTILKLADGVISSSITDALIRTAVILPNGIQLLSANYSTTYRCQIRNLKVDANRAGQTSLAGNELYGIQFQWVNNARIENVWVINTHSSGIGVWPSNPVTKVDAETVVHGCRVENNNASVAGQTLDAGIFVSNGTGQPSKVIVSDCISVGNRNGYCIEDTNGGVMINNCIGASNFNYGLTFHTATHCTVNGGFYYLNTYDGIGTTGAGERWHTLNGVQCYKNLRYGANLGHDYSVVGGQFVDNDSAGIVISSTVNNTITGAIIAGNGGIVSPTTPYGVYIIHGSLTDQNTITGCFFGNDYYSYRIADSQTYGIFEVGACSGNYSGNTFATYGSTQTAFNRGVASISIIRNNKGFVTENSGTGTIASGTTSAVITHGLGVTPTLDDLSIIFGEQGTADYGRWWISTITSTQFTLNVSADVGVSNLDFAWRAVVL